MLLFLCGLIGAPLVYVITLRNEEDHVNAFIGALIIVIFFFGFFFGVGIDLAHFNQAAHAERLAQDQVASEQLLYDGLLLPSGFVTIDNITPCATRMELLSTIPEQIYYVFAEPITDQWGNAQRTMRIDAYLNKYGNGRLACG